MGRCQEPLHSDTDFSKYAQCENYLKVHGTARHYKSSFSYHLTVLARLCNATVKTMCLNCLSFGQVSLFSLVFSPYFQTSPVWNLSGYSWQGQPFHYIFNMNYFSIFQVVVQCYFNYLLQYSQYMTCSLCLVVEYWVKCISISNV